MIYPISTQASHTSNRGDLHQLANLAENKEDLGGGNDQYYSTFLVSRRENISDEF